jgi:DNA-binding NarL/FixJ family response regulator
MALRINLVLVDDHDRLRSTLGDFLNSSGGLHVVGTAANGSEAVEICGQLNPDVVLMDIRMPGMDGIAATETIHKLYPHIQIIALTSGLKAEAEEAVSAGASGYIFKSVSVYEIVDLIRSIYAQKMASDDLAN